MGATNPRATANTVRVDRVPCIDASQSGITTWRGAEKRIRACRSPTASRWPASHIDFFVDAMAHYAPPTNTDNDDMKTFNDAYFPRTTYPAPLYPADSVPPVVQGTYSFPTNQASQTYPLLAVAPSDLPGLPYAPAPGVYCLSVSGTLSNQSSALMQVWFVVRYAYNTSYGKEVLNGDQIGCYLGSSPVVPANTLTVVNSELAPPSAPSFAGYSVLKNQFTLTGGLTVPITIHWSLACLNLTSIPKSLAHVSAGRVAPYYAGAYSFTANAAPVESFLVAQTQATPGNNLPNGIYLVTFNEYDSLAGAHRFGSTILSVNLVNAVQTFTYAFTSGAASTNAATANLFLYLTATEVRLRNNLTAARNARWFIYKFV